jgi:hypothetical protein
VPKVKLRTWTRRAAMRPELASTRAMVSDAMRQRLDHGARAVGRAFAAGLLLLGEQHLEALGGRESGHADDLRWVYGLGAGCAAPSGGSAE